MKLSEHLEESSMKLESPFPFESGNCLQIKFKPDFWGKDAPTEFPYAIELSLEGNDVEELTREEFNELVDRLVQFRNMLDMELKS